MPAPGARTQAAAGHLADMRVRGPTKRARSGSAALLGSCFPWRVSSEQNAAEMEGVGGWLSTRAASRVRVRIAGYASDLPEARRLAGGGRDGPCAPGGRRRRLGDLIYSAA
jgi:hypothetical protein